MTKEFPQKLASVKARLPKLEAKKDKLEQFMSTWREIERLKSEDIPNGQKACKEICEEKEIATIAAEEVYGHLMENFSG